MNDTDNTRRNSDDDRILGSLQLQARNLAAVAHHAREVIERLQGRRVFAEVTAEVLERLYSCDFEALIVSVGALRATLQRERE